MPIKGEILGDIRVSVCKTPDDKIFFYIKADNTEVLPIVYVIEDTLQQY